MESAEFAPSSVFSSLAISTFLSRHIDNRRRALILFPCLLYMVFISYANLCLVCSIQHSTQKQFDPPFRSSFSHSPPLHSASFPAATSSHFEAVSTLFFTHSPISTSRHRRRVFKPSVPAVHTHKIRLISTHNLTLSIHQPFLRFNSIHAVQMERALADPTHQQIRPIAKPSADAQSLIPALLDFF